MVLPQHHTGRKQYRFGHRFGHRFGLNPPTNKKRQAGHACLNQSGSDGRANTDSPTQSMTCDIRLACSPPSWFGLFFTLLGHSMPSTSANQDPTPDASTYLPRRAVVEAADTPAVAFALEFERDEHVAAHQHSRSQLLHPITGVVIVTTSIGRWMVPPDHALWIPAGVRHAVDIVGRVEMQSAYVKPDAISGLPTHLHVTGMTRLMRSLLAETVKTGPDATDTRAHLIQKALLHEIPMLPERPLGLPLPRNTRLTALCQGFVAQPSARLEIDNWADQAGMSRRTFTRVFRQQTGLSLSAWRQQACVMAALPRLSAGEPVTAVAMDLGYDSLPAFTTMFSRVMGAPPKTYLRNQRMQ
jgi:AraC-like DNA-binding protein/quercetin dioxygenase-like cupin family protein